MYKFVFEPSNCFAAKKVVKRDANTTVFLHGTLTLPSNCSFKFPSSNYVNIVSSCKGSYEISVVGFTKCCKGDKYNSLLGERLAEAYAKRDLYLFIYKTLKQKFDLLMDFLGIDKNDVPKYKKNALGDNVIKYKNLYEHELEHINNLLADLKHE